jgi:uncharacterized protein GlcG (DUF336 family)
MTSQRPPFLRSVACVLAASVSIDATAQVNTERNIGLDLANRIAAAGVAACTEKGFNVSTVVVDRAGVVKALQRADNAGPHTIPSATQKAYTAASTKVPTTMLMENAQKNPGAANIVHIPGLLLLGGGLPIKAGNDVIGAVGIGGAPAGAIDEQCAMAALDKVKDQLK